LVVDDEAPTQSRRTSTAVDLITAWSVRVAWIVAALATSGSSATWWAGWVVVAAASIVLHPVSLSLVRIVAPLVAVETAVHLASDPRGVVVATAVATALVVAFSAEYGRSHVQAAAYGAEQRHMLRPPASALFVTVAAWLVVGALLVAANVAANVTAMPWLEITLRIVVAALAAALAYRATTLARRWFVVVPAGLVIHDPLLLTDSIMIPRRDVTSLGTDTRTSTATAGALDVTGASWGPTLVVTAREACDVSLTDFGARLTRTGTRLHAGAVRFAPSRPGAAVTDALR
jgi:hypothetical protein